MEAGWPLVAGTAPYVMRGAAEGLGGMFGVVWRALKPAQTRYCRPSGFIRAALWVSIVLQHQPAS